MIQGTLLRDAFLSAANNITNSRRAVDELNIFPVPDGDTGTNMSMTINAAAAALKDFAGDSVGDCAEAAASALLRGARGNSGVILSLLFRGFAKGLKGRDAASGHDIAEALAMGVEAAYKAVMKPTEGTILTVARVGAEHGADAASYQDDPVAVWRAVCDGARQALAQTPELLPVLKKAGVVDAGGKGLVLIWEGMLSVFENGVIIESNIREEAEEEPAAKTAVAEWEGEITFTYCTEFIVGRAGAEPDPADLRSFLETIGDCVVVVDDDEIIKTHVHTDHPGKALEQAVAYGELLTVKIENMREQKRRAEEEAAQIAAKSAPEHIYAAPEKDYGFVAVAAGEGLQSLFQDLGCDTVVSGGQTMNPSTDDILKAIEATPAHIVYVLPNNKNILMAAEQAVPLADRKVVVVPTRTIPQGLSAMLAFNPEAAAEENLIGMQEACSHVDTGLVTFAARDSDFDGHKIKEGEIIALENGRLTIAEKTPVKALSRLARSMVKKGASFITLIYGEGISEEDAEEARRAVSSKVGSDVEVTLVNGGQPVYYFILSVE